MDRECPGCKFVTDDGEGRCRMCGAPFPKADTDEDTDPDPAPDTDDE